MNLDGPMEPPDETHPWDKACDCETCQDITDEWVWAHEDEWYE